MTIGAMAQSIMGFWIRLVVMQAHRFQPRSRLVILDCEYPMKQCPHVVRKSCFGAERIWAANGTQLGAKLYLWEGFNANWKLSRMLYVKHHWFIIFGRPALSKLFIGLRLNLPSFWLVSQITSSAQIMRRRTGPFTSNGLKAMLQPYVWNLRPRITNGLCLTQPTKGSLETAFSIMLTLFLRAADVLWSETFGLFNI